MRILLSILISIAPILGFAQTTGKVLEANAALGIQSVPNFVINSNAEKNTNAILQSGGTLSRDCSGPEVINGTCSFDWISDTSGQYLKFTANTMPEGSKGFTCSAYMRFQMDTLGAAASAYVVVEDGSGNAISPQTQLYATYNSVAAANDGTTGLALVEGYPCKPNQENRFAIYRSASTSARIHFDEVHVVQFPNAMAAPARAATNEASYTPTYTGFGTVSTSNMKWYVDGAYLYVYGSFVVGTPTAVEARMSLPTGYTSSSTISTLMLCGDASRNANATTLFRQGILCEPSTSYITFAVQQDTVNLQTKATGTGFSGTGNTIQINAKIPIAGANNANAIPASCINNPDCMNNFAARISSAGTVSDENFSFINGNAGLSTSTFTVTFDSNRFSVAPICQCTVVDVGGTTSQRDCQIQTVSTTQVVYGTTAQTSGTTSATAYGVSLTCSRAGTDVKPWGPIPWLTGMVSSNKPSSIVYIDGRSGGASDGTNCTGTCTVYDGSPGVTSTRTGTGTYEVNVPAGTCSTILKCSFSGVNVGTSLTACGRLASTAATTTKYTYACVTTNTNTATDSLVDFQCSCSR